MNEFATILENRLLAPRIVVYSAPDANNVLLDSGINLIDALQAEALTGWKDVRVFSSERAEYSIIPEFRLRFDLPESIHYIDFQSIETNCLKVLDSYSHSVVRDAEEMANLFKTVQIPFEKLSDHANRSWRKRTKTPFSSGQVTSRDSYLGNNSDNHSSNVLNVTGCVSMPQIAPAWTSKDIVTLCRSSSIIRSKDILTAIFSGIGFNPYDTFDHPVGLLFVAACNSPVKASNVIQSFRELESASSQLFRRYPWMNIQNIHRYYIVICKVSLLCRQIDEIKQLYNIIQQTFGIGSTSFLIVSDNAPQNSNCLKDTELSVLPMESVNDLTAVMLKCKNSFNSISLLINHYLLNVLIRHMEYTSHSLATQIREERQTTFSQVIDWFRNVGETQNRQPTTPQWSNNDINRSMQYYFPFSIEMRLRYAADLLFMLHDISGAVSLYKILKEVLSTEFSTRPFNRLYLAALDETFGYLTFFKNYSLRSLALKSGINSESFLQLRTSLSSGNKSFSYFLETARNDFAFSGLYPSALRVALFHSILCLATPERMVNKAIQTLSFLLNSHILSLDFPFSDSSRIVPEGLPLLMHAIVYDLCALCCIMLPINPPSVCISNLHDTLSMNEFRNDKKSDFPIHRFLKEASIAHYIYPRRFAHFSFVSANIFFHCKIYSFAYAGFLQAKHVISLLGNQCHMAPGVSWPLLYNSVHRLLASVCLRMQKNDDAIAYGALSLLVGKPCGTGKTDSETVRSLLLHYGQYISKSLKESVFLPHHILPIVMNHSIKFSSSDLISVFTTNESCSPNEMEYRQIQNIASVLNSMRTVSQNSMSLSQSQLAYRKSQGLSHQLSKYYILAHPSESTIEIQAEQLGVSFISKGVYSDFSYKMSLGDSNALISVRLFNPTVYSLLLENICFMISGPHQDTVSSSESIRESSPTSSHNCQTSFSYLWNAIWYTSSSYVEVKGRSQSIYSTSFLPEKTGIYYIMGLQWQLMGLKGMWIFGNNAISTTPQNMIYPNTPILRNLLKNPACSKENILSLSMVPMKPIPGTRMSSFSFPRIMVQPSEAILYAYLNPPLSNELWDGEVVHTTLIIKNISPFAVAENIVIQIAPDDGNHSIVFYLNDKIVSPVSPFTISQPIEAMKEYHLPCIVRAQLGEISKLEKTESQSVWLGLIHYTSISDSLSDSSSSAVCVKCFPFVHISHVRPLFNIECSPSAIPFAISSENNGLEAVVTISSAVSEKNSNNKIMESREADGDKLFPDIAISYVDFYSSKRNWAFHLHPIVHLDQVSKELSDFAQIASKAYSNTKPPCSVHHQNPHWHIGMTLIPQAEEEVYPHEKTYPSKISTSQRLNSSYVLKDNNIYWASEQFLWPTMSSFPSCSTFSQKRYLECGELTSNFTDFIGFNTSHSLQEELIRYFMSVDEKSDTILSLNGTSLKDHHAQLKIFIDRQDKLLSDTQIGTQVPDGNSLSNKMDADNSDPNLMKPRSHPEEIPENKFMPKFSFQKENQQDLEGTRPPELTWEVPICMGFRWYMIPSTTNSNTSPIPRQGVNYFHFSASWFLQLAAPLTTPQMTLVSHGTPQGVIRDKEINFYSRNPHIPFPLLSSVYPSVLYAVTKQPVSIKKTIGKFPHLENFSISVFCISLRHFPILLEIDICPIQKTEAGEKNSLLSNELLYSGPTFVRRIIEGYGKINISFSAYTINVSSIYSSEIKISAFTSSTDKNHASESRMSLVVLRGQMV